jgi:ATP-binding cassette, subfamily F, member 3
VRQRPNLLLLDEPTNHLDLDMRQALELALQDFDGAMVLVSHDRHLLRACCDEYLRVADGRLTPFEGDLEDYARWLRGRRSTPAVEGAREAPAAAEREDPRARRRQQAAQRAREKPLRDALTRAERELEAAQAELARCQGCLSDEALYRAESRSDLERAMAAQRAATVRVEQAEAAWLEAAEALEAFTA